MVAPGGSGPDDPVVSIGIEIGGRGLRAVLASPDGHVIDTARGIDREQTATGLVETACGLVEQVLHRKQIAMSQVSGIGVAFGGPVDVRRGVTIRSHRFPGFEGFPLAGVLEDRFEVRTVIENDARAAALGEYTHGAGRGSRDMVYLHLGRGVGGGIILGGMLLHGTSMTAGELGHMVVSANGPQCSCGKPGHLEAYASEPAIIARMRERLSDASAEAKATWLSSSGITVRRVFERYDVDDDARAVVDETVQVIGLAGANLVTALNPDAFVIGGYVTEMGPAITAAVRSKIRQYAFDAAAHRVVVASAQKGSDAGITGAVVLASRH